MRNPFRKPKKCELRHSVFLKQTILGVKCAERSDKHFEPTTFERRWDMNVNLHKVVQIQYPPVSVIRNYGKMLAVDLLVEIPLHCRALILTASGLYYIIMYGKSRKEKEK